MSNLTPSEYLWLIWKRNKSPFVLFFVEGIYKNGKDRRTIWTHPRWLCFRLPVQATERWSPFLRQPIAGTLQPPALSDRTLIYTSWMIASVDNSWSQIYQRGKILYVIKKLDTWYLGWFVIIRISFVINKVSMHSCVQKCGHRLTNSLFEWLFELKRGKFCRIWGETLQKKHKCVVILYFMSQTKNENVGI